LLESKQISPAFGLQPLLFDSGADLWETAEILVSGIFSQMTFVVAVLFEAELWRCVNDIQYPAHVSNSINTWLVAQTSSISSLTIATSLLLTIKIDNKENRKDARVLQLQESKEASSREESAQLPTYVTSASASASISISTSTSTNTNTGTSTSTSPQQRR
jgi:hypothetical protein